MTVVLACPWDPRGELARFLRYYPRLTTIYSAVVVALRTPDTGIITALKSLGVAHQVFDAWSGRHTVLRMALDTEAESIHYVDMDRLVRWVETKPDELAATAARVTTVDTLIIGRTPAAYATHARSLIDTEALPNRVFSHYFGRADSVMDFSAGSRGLSRRAAAMILHNSPEENALAMDNGWAVLVRRAGMTWDYIEVDGLDWETADHYRDFAADATMQQALAAETDSQAERWVHRVHLAGELVRLGLAAVDQELVLDASAR